MQKIIDYTKQYIGVISIVLALCILLTYSLSYFKVNTESKRAAEMYIGEVKYTISIDGTGTNTLSVQPGETIVDINITNQNEINTYYKLLYSNNSNILVSYFNQTKNTSEEVTSYKSPSDSVESKSQSSLKLKIMNNGTSDQTLTFKVSGGYSTNTLADVEVPNTYTEIISLETPSTNTYFCKTNDTLTQGLEYVDGQYTYGYKKEGAYSSTTDLAWSNIFNNGWGVQLTDKASTVTVTTNVCTYVNNKPVVSAAFMFSRSKATALDVSKLNTSNFINMYNMFSYSSATSLDLRNFNTSNVVNMSYMFSKGEVATLDLSNFDTSNVTDMSSMFSFNKLKTIDVSSLDTSSVTNMSGMFSKGEVATLDLSNFDTSNVTNMSNMFNGSQTASIKGIEKFNTRKVTNMQGMFHSVKIDPIDISSFDTSNVTNMKSMFSYSKATTLDLSNFDTSKVTNMGNMFMYSTATEIVGLENFNTSNVTIMENMFRESKVLTLNLTSFDTSKVNNMYQMFMNSSNLTTIYASDKFVTNKITNTNLGKYLFSNDTKLVGGAGTAYSSTKTDKTYARIDGGTSSPGYFTRK